MTHFIRLKFGIDILYDCCAKVINKGKKDLEEIQYLLILLFFRSIYVWTDRITAYNKRKENYRKKKNFVPKVMRSDVIRNLNLIKIAKWCQARI